MLLRLLLFFLFVLSLLLIIRDGSDKFREWQKNVHPDSGLHLFKFHWGKLGKKLGQKWFQISIFCRCCFRVEFQKKEQEYKRWRNQPKNTFGLFVVVLLMLLFRVSSIVFFVRGNVGKFEMLIWGYVVFSFFCSSCDVFGWILGVYLWSRDNVDSTFLWVEQMSQATVGVGHRLGVL